MVGLLANIVQQQGGVLICLRVFTRTLN